MLLREKKSARHARQEKKARTSVTSRLARTWFRPALESLETRLAPASGLEIDPDFGQNGMALTDIAVPRTANSENTGTATAIQADGKIVVAGSEITPANGWCFSVVRYNTDGSLDTSFGTGGRTAVDFFGRNDYAQDVAIQSDGKIVVAGYADTGSSNDFALLRLNSNGTLDTTFGSGGKVSSDIYGQDYAYGVAIHPSTGQIFVVGESNDPYMSAARYSSSGTLETTNRWNYYNQNTRAYDIAYNPSNDRFYFVGADFYYTYTYYGYTYQDRPMIGYFNTGLGLENWTVLGTNGYSYFADVAYNPTDGRMYAVGSYQNNEFLISKWNSGLGQEGWTTTGFSGEDYAQGVAVQSDGNLVVTGYSSGYQDMIVARYNTGLGLDSSFDSDGWARVDYFGTYDYGYGVAVQNDGKIVSAGYTYRNTANDFAVVRFNSNGSLDSSFDGDGKVNSDFAITEQAQETLVQTDGKTIVVGTAVNTSGNFDFALTRYHADGSLDNTFGTGGRALWNYSGNDFAYAAALQADGRIVVVGHSEGSGYMLVARFNSNGSIDTYTTTSNWGGERAYGVAIDPNDGRIFVVGRTNANNGDFFMARYSTSLGAEIYRQYDFNGSDVAYDIAWNPADSCFWVVGYSGGYQDMIISRWNADVWLQNWTNVNYSGNDYAYGVAYSPIDSMVYVTGATARVTPSSASGTTWTSTIRWPTSPPTSAAPIKAATLPSSPTAKSWSVVTATATSSSPATTPT